MLYEDIDLAEVEERVSSAFAEAFEAHLDRETDPDEALADAMRAASALVPEGVYGSFDDETLVFRAENPIIEAAKKVYSNPPLRHEDWNDAKESDLAGWIAACEDNPDASDDHDILMEAYIRLRGGESVWIAVDQDGPFVVWASQVV